MNISVLAIIIVLYLLVMAYLGFLGYTQTKNAKDYLVAGRSVHPMIMAISYGATFISTSAIVGFGGVAGMFGMGLLWLTFLNILVGIFIAFVFFGKRVRKMGHNLEAHTFPEFLGKRFQSSFIQKASGLIIFCSMPLYTSVVLIGGARFMQQTLNINYEISLLIFALVVAAYVIAGGIKGVMYTDAMQGVIMFVGMSVLLVFTYMKLGGITAAHQALTNLAPLVPEKLAKIGHLGWTSMPAFGSPWWWTLVSTIVAGVGIGVLAQPQLVVRFMTVKSNRELNRAVAIGGVFILAMTGVAFVVGALSNVFFYNTTGKISIAVAKGNVDLIIPNFINAALPSWFVYLFMLTLLAAAMSTLSSQFHAMGTSIGRDFLEKIFKFKENSILVNRIGIIVAILVSLILGYKLPESIIAPGTAIFFGICAATFLPAYCAAIFSKRVTKQAAVSSIIIGFLSSVFCLLFLHKKEAAALGVCKMIFGKEVLIAKMPWPVVDPIALALPVAIVVLILVTMVTKVKDKKHIEASFEGIK
ncbi:MAG: sodium:solute symporter family protein [Candidatus Margulisbacteria bacterium]|nr:sodium:solute symporter family protein [Candidatus Margulisiibacteriota bacterium]